MQYVRTVSFDRENFVQRFAEEIVGCHKKSQFRQTFHSLECTDLVVTEIDRFQRVQEAQLVHSNQIVESQVE